MTASLVERGGSYIWKPENGSMGQNIVRLEVQSGSLVARRGSECQPFQFPASTAHAWLLERTVEQHAFWRALSPHSLNTLRIMTMWTPGDPAPFIGVAMQRIGIKATLPTDNWSGGGIIAPVNLPAGIMGIGKTKPGMTGRENVSYRDHPETGARIEGASLRTCKRLWSVPYGQHDASRNYPMSDGTSPLTHWAPH